MCCKVVNYLRFFFSLLSSFPYFFKCFFFPFPLVIFFPPSFLFLFISYFSMLFLLASFTITLSHQLFCTCSITCCLLFCANVYISPCYFTLCNFILVSIVAHLCFTLTPLHFACYSYLSICYLTLQVVTLPFDLLFLACVSLCVVLCFISLCVA